jgi:hypothetical protein
LITLAVSDATVSTQSTGDRPSASATAAPYTARQTAPFSTKRQPTRIRRAAATTRKPTARRLGARDSLLERKLLNQIVQAPAGKLPRVLIDAKTGLAKNNLHAVCRRSGGSRSFLCLVQPVHHKPGEGLFVRYRSNRKGTAGRFFSYHYRAG